jgi:hypothetical protein
LEIVYKENKQKQRTNKADMKQCESHSE